MKVLLLNYEYPPIGGGGGNATKYILSELKNYKDLSIDLITTSEDNKDKTLELNERIKIYKLNVKKKHLHHWREIEILRYLHKGLKLANKLHKTSNYDLSHAFFTIPSGYISFRLNIPYLVSIRGSDVPGFNERFKLHYVALKPLIRKIWKKANFVIANSEGLKNLALKTSRNQQINIIRNGVDTNEFKPKSKNSSNELKIICVTRLIKRKGVKYLIYALNNLKNLNITLTLIGSGPEKKDLLAKINKFRLQNKIRLIDYIPHSELPKYYNNADLFVLPSLNEGMSNSILEAMACGLPIITTNTGGTAELIKNNGIIVKKRSIIDLEKAISTIYLDKNLREKMGKESRELALKLDWREVAKTYYEFYLKCVV
jgi:glycosyltransferase involved in cell wall biosynthesis